MQFPTTPASVLLLVLLAITIILSIAYVLRVRAGRIPKFRPLFGIVQLRALFGDVAETGRPLHVATGTGQQGAFGTTAETIASLLITQRIAEATTQRGGTVAATSGDIVAHAALRGTVQQAFRQAGYASDYQPQAVQLVAQTTPIAYAAGVAARYQVEPMAASVVAGNYDTEALLISEEGAAQNIPQIAATTSLTALPVLALSAQATLVGEDLFAAEAYLSDDDQPKARLLTHDALRWVLLVLIVVGLIWQLIAPLVGLPQLA